MFTHSFNGSIVESWPNGKPYLKQEKLLVNIFDLMADELHQMQKAKADVKK